MNPNVLLVVLDTVRARNVGVYGHHNGTTPFLDAFASERATLYEQARAPASRSLDSHVSIFTGAPVSAHNVVKSTDRVAAGETVFDELDEQGYATGVFSENSWLTHVDVGLKDAFETVEGPRNIPFPDAVDPTRFVVEHGQHQYRRYLRECMDADSATTKSLLNGLAVKLGSDYPRLLPAGRVTTPATVYVDRFLDWSERESRPWAACLNLMDAHHPYEPAPEYDHWGGASLSELQDEIDDVKWEFNGGHRPWWQRRALEGLYDGAIRQLDANLQRLVEALEDRGDLDETLLIVLSDHGEGFGEPSLVRPATRIASHSVGVHEVLLHVPLVVKYPGQVEPRTVSEVATVTNVPSAVDAALEGGWTGREFVPDQPVIATVHGLDDPVRERASRYCDNLSPFTATARVVYEDADRGVRKFVTWRSEAVTVEAPNAQTAFRTARTDSGRVEARFAHLEDVGIKETGEGFDALDEGTAQHLRDLGYA